MVDSQNLAISMLPIFAKSDDVWVMELKKTLKVLAAELSKATCSKFSIIFRFMWNK